LVVSYPIRGRLWGDLQKLSRRTDSKNGLILSAHHHFDEQGEAMLTNAETHQSSKGGG